MFISMKGKRPFGRFKDSSNYNDQEEEKSYIQWLVAQGLFAEGKVQDALPYYFSILNSTFREKALFQIGKGLFF